MIEEDDKMCACGHKKIFHEKSGMCMKIKKFDEDVARSKDEFCGCEEFKEKT